MNCWPSGKYVHLLYMFSILGWGSFCFNYCLNSACHGGDQFVALLRWYGSPGFFDSGLQLICLFFWSLVSHFPLDIRKLNTALQATSPPFLQTLGPWFPNEIQNLLSSEKRTLNHWATVKFFFSSDDASDDNCIQIPWHVCVWWVLMAWPQPQSIPCEVHPNSWIDFAWKSS